MMIPYIIGAAILLIMLVSGLSVLERKRGRTLSPTIVLSALLTFGLICVSFMQDADLLPPFTPAIDEVLLGATWFIFAFLVLKAIDLLLVGEYLIHRHGAHVPDVVRVLMTIVGLAGTGLVILQVLLDINPIALVALPTVMTAIVGVALRDTLVRFFSGIALGKIIRVGDWVSVLDREGMVMGINFSHVTLTTRERAVVTLPNDTVVHSNLINFSRTPLHICSVLVDAALGVSPTKVSQVLVQAAESVEGVLAEPKPLAQVHAFKDSSVQYKLKFAIADYGQEQVLESSVRSYVWHAFRREGIEIPCPQLGIHTDKIKMSQKDVWLDDDQIILNLCNVDIFSILSPDHMSFLAKNAHEQHFLPGERLVRQGEPGEHLYIILEGSVDVQVEVEGLSKVVNTLHKGQFFGEMSLLTGEPRSATVVAKTVLRVLVIGKQALSRVLDGNADLIDKIGSLVVTRQLHSQAAHEELSQERANLDIAREKRSLIKRIQSFLWKRKASLEHPREVPPPVFNA